MLLTLAGTSTLGALILASLLPLTFNAVLSARLSRSGIDTPPTVTVPGAG